MRPMGWVVSLVVISAFSSCSKSVGHDGKGKGRTQAVTEPPAGASPLPSASASPVPNPSQSPSPVPSASPYPFPTPSPSIPVGDCGDNPFRNLSDYSVFSRGQLVVTDVHAEGRMAALMQSTVNRGEVGMKLSPEGTRVDLGIRDQLQVTQSRVPFGRVMASKKITATHLDAPFGHHIGKLDSLLQDEARVKAIHHFLFSLQTEGGSALTCVKPNDCDLHLRGENTVTNVIDVPAADLGKATRIRFDVPMSSTVVVRIRGNKLKSLSMNSQSIDRGGVPAERIIWTVSGIQKLLTHKQNIPGTWVAPGTQMHSNDARFEGGVLSSCVFSNRTRFSLNSFRGCLPQTKAGE